MKRGRCQPPSPKKSAQAQPATKAGPHKSERKYGQTLRSKKMPLAGRAGSGYDAGKRVKGRKRHIAVDVDGNLLAAQVHPAGVQDRDGAVPLLVELHRRRSTVQTVFADGGYAGDKLRTALREAGCQVTVDVVRKPADSKGFEVLPRRWVVERTFGWLRRCRRLSKDFERTMASGLAWLRLALIRVLVRRLTRHQVSVTY